MTRLLHLLGRAPDHQTQWTLQALREDAEAGRDVTTCTIGRGGDYANLLWAVTGLRREVGAFDVVHAWDGRALAAAALAGAGRTLFNAPPGLRRLDVARLRFVMRHRDVAVVCSTAGQQRRLATRGIPAGRVHLIRPPVGVRPALVARDAGLRRRLGLGDDDFVLLAPGESTRPTAHERAVWTGSILHVADERYRVLLWGRGPRAGAAAGLGRKLGQPGLVVVAERTLGRPVAFADLLPAADAILATARGPVAPLALALGMAAGVPIVSADTPALAELTSDDPIALTTPTDAPRLLARRVLDLRAEAALRERVVTAARAAARALFEPGRALQQYRSLYAAGISAGAGAGADAAASKRATGNAVFSTWRVSNLAETQLNLEDR